MKSNTSTRNTNVETVTPALEAVLNRYIMFVMQKGLSKNTIKAYNWHLSQFLTHLTDNDVTLKQLGEDHITDWTITAYNRWNSKATVRQGMNALVGFLRWANEKSLLKEDVAQYVIVPTVKDEPQRTLWRDEIEKMFATCGSSIPSRIACTARLLTKL